MIYITLHHTPDWYFCVPQSEVDKMFIATVLLSPRASGQYVCTLSNTQGMHF